MKSLCIFADNAKHNQNEKVEDLGAIWHAQPLLCGIGVLAMHLFACFHINNERINFVPQYSNTTGEFGSHLWYQYAAAMSNAEDPKPHFLPRDALGK